MAEKKRYYWIKLKENFFDLETIDWLISQKNGCEYIVLYQKLCLLTANKDGKLAMQIGEMIIPYDVNKIARDTKFSLDTVIVAMELFKKIGLIYEQEDGILKIPYVEEMVGSETSSAQRVREYRQRKALQCNTQCNEDVTQEIDNKSIDNRDKSKEKELKRKRFEPPTLEEVKAYCVERGNNINAEHFIDYYTSNGWLVGKNKMKDWKAAIRTWERNGYSSNGKKYGDNGIAISNQKNDLDDVF